MPDPWSMALPVLAVVFLLALAGVIAVVVRGLLVRPARRARTAAPGRRTRNEELADLRELHSRGLLTGSQYDEAVRRALQDYPAAREG